MLILVTCFAALTYEILYSTVFRLPDVIYAVERMLHDPPEGTHVSRIQVSPYDETQETLTLSGMTLLFYLQCLEL